MERLIQRGGRILLVALALLGCGPKGPWSPASYPEELARYQKDPAHLPAAWEKFYVEGQEVSSFFFRREELDANIIVTFTCGKYTDITLDLLAEHVIFPMGRTAQVESRGFVPGGRVDVYHLRAKGKVEYEEPKKDQNRGPEAPMVMDIYTVGENNCVVDVVYAAPPEQFERGLPDFHAALRDYGIPLAD